MFIQRSPCSFLQVLACARWSHCKYHRLFQGHKWVASNLYQMLLLNFYQTLKGRVWSPIFYTPSTHSFIVYLALSPQTSDFKVFFLHFPYIGCSTDFFPPPEMVEEGGLARPVVAGIVATICFLAAAVLFSTMAACFVNKQRRRKLKRKRGNERVTGELLHTLRLFYLCDSCILIWTSSCFTSHILEAESIFMTCWINISICKFLTSGGFSGCIITKWACLS